MKLKPTLVTAIALGLALPALCAEKAKPLKVYILAGQSTMTGIVHNRTFEHLKMSPEASKEYADLFNKDGSTVVIDDVRVSQWMGKE